MTTFRDFLALTIWTLGPGTSVLVTWRTVAWFIERRPS